MTQNLFHDECQRDCTANRECTFVGTVGVLVPLSTIVRRLYADNRGLVTTRIKVLTFILYLFVGSVR